MHVRCYSEKVTDLEAWHRQGSQTHNKTQTTYNQPKLPSTGTVYRTNPFESQLLDSPEK